MTVCSERAATGRMESAMKNTESNDQNVLLVRTMGGFSMSWNGKPVGGVKTRDSQFIRLMEVVLHFR